MKFNIARHSIRDVDVIEVFADDGRFIATVTPGDTDEEIRVLSKYAAAVQSDIGLVREQGVVPGEGMPASVRVKLQLDTTGGV